jgi:hypothetical protein
MEENVDSYWMHRNMWTTILYGLPFWNREKSGEKPKNTVKLLADNEESWTNLMSQDSKKSLHNSKNHISDDVMDMLVTGIIGGKMLPFGIRLSTKSTH